MADERYKSECEFCWNYSKHLLDKLRTRAENETTADGLLATDCARMFLESIQSILGRVLTELNANQN